MSRLAQERAALRRLADGAVDTESGIGPLVRRGAWAILFTLWLFAAAIAAGSAWLLLDHAREHTAATAVSLEQFARRTVSLASFVADEYEEYLDERGSLTDLRKDPAGNDRLKELVKWLPPESSMGLVGVDGKLISSTLPFPSELPSATDRRWFRAHVHDGLQFYVGPAIRSRLSKTDVFTYSSSYRGKDGTLLGIISLGIPSTSITGLAPDQRHTDMALVQHEGFVVAAQPFTADLVGRPLPLPGPAPETDADAYGPLFGRWSVVSMRNIPDLKLYAVVGVPVADVMGPLFWGIGIGLPLLVLLSYLLLTLSRLLQQENRRVVQALSDNKVLFQEVHHRVKNNLQVISSLLRLQTERLPPELRPLLDETGARVRAIALVHEQIYRTASPSDVQLDRFLAQLVQQLSASMIGGTAHITTDLQPVTIGLDRAVPVAILATEAITNAIKHGLDGGDGVIDVRLWSTDARNHLEVRDSGRGEIENGQSGLGTRIMTALARQLDGEWNLAPLAGGGTRFLLSWPS